MSPEHISPEHMKTCKRNSDCPAGLTCHDAVFYNICMTPGNKVDKAK